MCGNNVILKPLQDDFMNVINTMYCLLFLLFVFVLWLNRKRFLFKFTIGYKVIDGFYFQNLRQIYAHNNTKQIALASEIMIAESSINQSTFWQESFLRLFNI